MNSTNASNSRLKLIGIVVAIVVIAGVVLLADHLKTSRAADNTAVVDTTKSASTQSSANSADTTATDNTAASTAAYTDGTYTSSVKYFVSQNNESIKVTLTVANGVVTNSNIVNSESDHDSAVFQEGFAENYKAKVVGKSISGLSLSTVSGASETTRAFNDAVAQIASQAKV